jgi:hypothetical protein
MKHAIVLGILSLSIALAAGCSAGPQTEEVDEQSQAITCPVSINCYSNQPPGTGYLCGTQFCPQYAKIYCKWCTWPSYWTVNSISVPPECPSCTNDVSHGSGHCGGSIWDPAATWTCS